MSNDDYNKKFSDFIAIPLTSNLRVRDHALLITNRQMETGVLKEDSKAKVDKISSIDKEIIIKKIGRINKDTYNELKKMLLNII
jgi:mRNA-degrading endonuclease toxin of MazEF toxin-antitoxin module